MPANALRLSSVALIASLSVGGGEPSAPQLEAPAFSIELDGDSVTISITAVENATSYSVQRRSLTSISGTPSAWATLDSGLGTSYTTTLPEQWVRYDFRLIAHAEGYTSSEPSGYSSAFLLPTAGMSAFLANSYFDYYTAGIAVIKITNANWPETTHTYEAGTTAGPTVQGTITESPTPPVGFTINTSANHSYGGLYTAKARRLLPNGSGGFAASSWATYDYQFYPPE